MTIKTRIRILSVLLVFTLVYFPAPVSASGNSSTHFEPPAPGSGIDSQINGQTDVLRELKLNDHLQFPIIQQPHGNRNFVSPRPDYLTEFQTATDFGTVGLLAHNYLAGQYFFQISPGKEISLTYIDGRTERFVVTEIQRYQALVPDSPSSDFIDLGSGEYLTATQLFWKTYGNRPGTLILQTCIGAQQNQSWGRLFIIAEPVE